MNFANKYLLKGFLFFIFSLTVLSCGKESDLVVEGMSPIYVSPTDFSLVRTESPKEFDKLGNIVNLGDYIFIVEKNKGIHIIDNVDPLEIQSITELLDLEKTLFLVISKSGSTLETISQFTFFKDLLNKQGLDFKKHFTIIA